VVSVVSVVGHRLVVLPAPIQRDSTGKDQADEHCDTQVPPGADRAHQQRHRPVSNAAHVPSGGCFGRPVVVSIKLSLAGRERGFGNDVLLVGQSVVALPLMWVISTGSWSVPASIWWAATICATYFVGSVIHVKSLIREADDRRWHRADVAFHIVALAWAAMSFWLLVPFAVALVRSLVMRPGLRPGVIGGVEIVVSLLVLIATLMSVL